MLVNSLEIMLIFCKYAHYTYRLTKVDQRKLHASLRTVYYYYSITVAFSGKNILVSNWSLIGPQGQLGRVSYLRSRWKVCRRRCPMQMKKWQRAQVPDPAKRSAKAAAIRGRAAKTHFRRRQSLPVPNFPNLNVWVIWVHDEWSSG